MRTQQIRKRPNPNAAYSKRPAKRGRYTRGVPRTTGATLIRAGEMKYFDCALAQNTLASSITWTSTVRDPVLTPVVNTNCLFAPKVGTESDQRIGKACKMFKLKLKGTIIIPAQTNQTASDEACKVRIMLVEDMQTNGSQMDGADLMAAQGTVQEAINSFQTVNNFGRFRVWKDKTFILENPNSAHDGTNMEIWGLKKQFKFNLNWKNGYQIRFAAAAGTVGDIVDKSFHIIAMTDNTNLAPAITYCCRVCFKD